MTTALLGGTLTPTLVKVGGVTTGSDQTTYSSSLSLGAKDANGRRWTVVVAGAYSDVSNRVVNSVTVDGSAATIVVSTPSDRPTCAIAIIDSSSMANTVTVAATMSGACFAGGLYVYRMFDIVSSTPFSTNTSGAVVGLSVLNTDVAASGCTVAVAVTRNGGGSSTWTGLTEDVDANYDSNDLFTVASGGTVGFPSAIQVQNSGKPTEARACVASWR